MAGYSKEKKPYIIIPSLNPGEELVDYCKELASLGLDKIIVLNDGSGQEYSHIFNELEGFCTVLTHEQNMGKGEALKDAFKYFLNLPDANDYIGVVTCDSDGQHLAPDVVNVAESLANGEAKLVLGARDFASSDVPKKSLIGNKWTTIFFKVFVGAGVTDTQTGLRGISADILPEVAELKGERYEYEMRMLTYAIENKISVKEVPIEVVYNDNNSGTHYVVKKDAPLVAVALLGKFVKFALSGVLSYIVDNGFFNLFDLVIFAGLANRNAIITVSAVLARILSSIFNFILNKKTVFNQNGNVGSTLARYYALAAIQLGVSTGLVVLLVDLIGLPAGIVKAVIDIIISIISFNIQKRFVFKNKK